MSKRKVCLFITMIFAAVAAAAVPQNRQEQALAKATGQVCRSARIDGDCRVLAFSRRALTDDVAEYQARVAVGPGEHEVIGLHRVVKERHPYVPIRTRQAIMMAHGDAWPFAGAFLASAASPAVPDAQALPVFLAANGIDVWGIDFRWTQVPESITDFGFMEDWSFETDAHDLGIALGVARLVRAVTGNGFAKLHLLGWSRGGQIGYAYLNGESQRPPGLRHVKGYIPVDIYLKTDDEGLRQDACTRADILQATFDSSVFEDRTGLLVELIGTLAASTPGDPSPVFAGFTNRQAALVTGAATFLIFPGGLPPVPFYHFTGGTFDELGIPDGLVYSLEPYLIDFLQGSAPFEPVRVLLDGEQVICDEVDVPFDDHLADIEVPVLYVAGGGGFGDFGLYTTTLLGSSDVTPLVVSLTSDRLLDIGHADIFLAEDAQELFWQPLLEWIEARP